MVSFLVMKNRVRRLLSRKSTYIIFALVPVFIILAGNLTSALTTKEIRVGVVNDELFREQQGIHCEKVNEDTMYTDFIMGNYDYLIEDDSQWQKVLQERQPEGTETDKTAQLLSMLLMTYMIIATVYSSEMIRDRKEGLLERFCFAGHGKRAYVAGYLQASSLLTGVQLLCIFLVWKLTVTGFSISLTAFLKAFLFILVVSNVYGALISFISKTEMMAGILSSSLAALLAIVGGAFADVGTMPAVIEKMSLISPIHWLVSWIL